MQGLAFYKVQDILVRQFPSFETFANKQPIQKATTVHLNHTGSNACALHGYIVFGSSREIVGDATKSMSRCR